MGNSFSTIPPVKPFTGLGFWCFLTLLIPPTNRYSPRTRNTLPRLPLSLPVITITSSFFLILRMIFLGSIRCRLQHFWCQRNDLHELLGTQLACHRPEDTCSDRL